MAQVALQCRLCCFNRSCLDCPAAVLGISGLVEGYSLWVAVRAVNQGAQAAGLTFWEFVKRGMDPTSIAVMMEDAAAVTGLAIAGAFPAGSLAGLHNPHKSLQGYCPAPSRPKAS